MRRKPCWNSHKSHSAGIARHLREKALSAFDDMPTRIKITVSSSHNMARVLWFDCPDRHCEKSENGKLRPGSNGPRDVIDDKSRLRVVFSLLIHTKKIANYSSTDIINAHQQESNMSKKKNRQQVQDFDHGRGQINDCAVKAIVTSPLFRTRVVKSKKGKGSYSRKAKGGKWEGNQKLAA